MVDSGFHTGCSYYSLTVIIICLWRKVKWEQYTHVYIYWYTWGSLSRSDYTGSHIQQMKTLPLWRQLGKTPRSCLGVVTLNNLKTVRIIEKGYLKHSILPTLNIYKWSLVPYYSCMPYTSQSHSYIFHISIQRTGDIHDTETFWSHTHTYTHTHMSVIMTWWCGQL